MDSKDLKQLDTFRKLINSQKPASDFFKHRTDKKNSSLFRRGIYASKDLTIGKRLNKEDLRYVRPLGNEKFTDLKHFLGRKLNRKVKKMKKSKN